MHIIIIIIITIILLCTLTAQSESCNVYEKGFQG